MKKLLAILLIVSLAFGALSLTACGIFGKDSAGTATGSETENNSAVEDENTDIIVGKYVFYEFYAKYGDKVARARYSDLGAPYKKTDGSMEFKDDNTFTLSLKNETVTGTWKNKNGKYYGMTETEAATSAELEIIMEDDDHIFLPPSGDSDAIQMGFIFERENAADTPSYPDGTYKLFESKKLDGDKESRVRVTDPNSLDSAEDFVITFNSDGTLKVFGFGGSGSGT